METTVDIHGHPVRISTTARADRALAARTAPLEAQMELYFSCLIRLKVRFHETVGEHAVAVNEQLKVSFRPVMTAACGTDYEGEEPPLTDFPIANEGAFTPRWLRVDFAHGEWQGEFGFAH